MNVPLVSIILPTYNGSRFIRKSLDSCLQQTYSNIELIIVNDCSTDETPEIIEEYASRDPRVKVIHNQANQKLPASLNIGFAAATGFYYTWTSDDNFYAPEAIARMANILAQQPEYDLVYANYYKIDDDDRVIGVSEFNDINESTVNWEGCGACFLYKAAVHTRNKGYNISAFLIEDYDFFLRASLHSRFYFYKVHDLYYYRFHADSLTGTMASAVFDLQKIIVERQLPKLLQHVSKSDEILYYRKYTVYYAVSKNNLQKVKYYLGKLYSKSRKQALITVGYVIAKKIANMFSVVFYILYSFVRLLFRKN